MNRDELIEAGARALAGQRDAEWWGFWVPRAATVLDAVEPLIRADERENPRRRALALEMERRTVAEQIAQAIEAERHMYAVLSVADARLAIRVVDRNAAIARRHGGAS